MSELPLFPELPEADECSVSIPVTRKELRLSEPVRNQAEIVVRDLDAVLGPGHCARAIWSLMERLDLSGFSTAIRSAFNGPGRAATDPKLLLALWLYATVEGIGSARQLNRLCQEHDAFKWLRGGVPVNYHMLSDFRVEHGKAMESSPWLVPSAQSSRSWGFSWEQASHISAVTSTDSSRFRVLPPRRDLPFVQTRIA